MLPLASSCGLLHRVAGLHDLVQVLNKTICIKQLTMRPVVTADDHPETRCCDLKGTKSTLLPSTDVS